MAARLMNAQAQVRVAKKPCQEKFWKREPVHPHRHTHIRTSTRMQKNRIMLITQLKSNNNV